MNTTRPIHAVLLPTDGPPQAVDVPLAEGPQLRKLQELVGGWIEMVYLRAEPPMTMIINEEGKLRGLPVNRLATELARLPDDLIVGPAVLVGVARNGNITDLDLGWIRSFEREQEATGA